MMYHNAHPKPAPKPKASRKPIKRVAVKKKFKASGEGALFAKIWATKKHNCEWCHVYLGETFNHCFFDHIIEKSKSEALRLEPTNIRLLCLPCHHARHFGTKKQIQERMKIKI